MHRRSKIFHKEKQAPQFHITIRSDKGGQVQNVMTCEDTSKESVKYVSGTRMLVERPGL